MGFNNPFTGMSNEAQAALIGGAFQIGGGLLSGAGQARRDASNRETEVGMNKVDALIALLKEQGSRSSDEMTNARLGYQGAAAAIGNPLDIQKSRQDMAMRRALLFDGPNGRPQYVKPASGVMQQYANIDALPDFKSAKPFFTDEAMANSEKPFWGAVGGMTGGKVGPDLAGSGYQNVGSAQGSINSANQGFAADQLARETESDQEMARTRAAVMQALSESAGGSSNAVGQQEKKGGFWRGLGRVAALAAPIIAAPFTGGTSLALIGAGSAAAGSLLNGGSPRQALGSAALSGGLSYAGGRMGQGGNQMNNRLGPQSLPAGQMAAPAGRLVYPQNTSPFSPNVRKVSFG